MKMFPTSEWWTAPWAMTRRLDERKSGGLRVRPGHARLALVLLSLAIWAGIIALVIWLW